MIEVEPKDNWGHKARNEFKDVLHRHVTKKTSASRTKHPTIYWMCVLALIIFDLIIIGTPALILYNSWPEKNIPKDQPGTVLSSQDKSGCKKFDIADWQTGQGQLVREGDLWSVSSISSGGLLRYKESIPLSSEVKIVFVPHSEKEMNFVIHAHSLYEIVVGDGGYKATTLKTSSGNNQLMTIIPNTDGYTRNIFKEGEFNPGIDATIVLDQTISPIDEDSYEVNIRILHRAGEEEEEDKIFATYDFPLPPKFNYEETSMRLSIGLLPASNNTKVAAEFLCFEVN